MASKKTPPSKEDTPPKDETRVNDLSQATASARKMAEKLRGNLPGASLSPGFYRRYWLKRPLSSMTPVSEDFVRRCIGAGLIGADPHIDQLMQDIRLCASGYVPVLITGDTGTGKEVVARCIHEVGNRRNKRFVSINCAGVPLEILQSELFGHEKGAFTGAIAKKEGRIEEADGGTLFLDEVGDMPPELQAALLRFLNDGTYSRVGEAKERKVDVRVICATNQDLEEAIREKRFRSDLLYRLRGMEIEMWPLFARPGDLPLLLYYFVRQYNERAKGHSIQKVSNWAIQELMLYHWPGNVREMEKVVQNACHSARFLSDHPQWLVSLAIGALEVHRDYLMFDVSGGPSNRGRHSEAAMLFYWGEDPDNREPYGVVDLEAIPRLDVRERMEKMDRCRPVEYRGRWTFGHRLWILQEEEERARGRRIMGIEMGTSGPVLKLEEREGGRPADNGSSASEESGTDNAPADELATLYDIPVWKEARKAFQYEFINRRIEKYDNDKKKAAGEMGLSVRQIDKIMKMNSEK